MKKRNDAFVLPRGNGASGAGRGGAAGDELVQRGRMRLGKRWTQRPPGGNLSAKTGLENTNREIQVSVSSAADIVEARQKGRALAMDLGFDATDLTTIATAISELARNLVDHAEHGTITLSSIRHNGFPGLCIVASDEGSEIRNILPHPQSGCSSAQPLGVGIPGATRMMDDFEVKSKPGKGTVVTMRKWLHPADLR
jgi:serine/threonine-protein kinase RsbT